VTTSITFKHATQAHRPLLRRWLAMPHVVEWWGDPDQEINLIAYGKENDGSEGFVILLHEKPVGYIQSWIPSRFDNEDWERALSPDVRGIDILIGETSAIGRGANIIGVFVDRLLAQGHRHLVIDPDKRNLRAIRAYEKAGFIKYDETENSLLMELRGK
jgi:aminoglycoside 6'-N-acetyltransferase